MKTRYGIGVRTGLAAAIVALAVPAAALCQVAGSEGVKQGEKFAKDLNDQINFLGSDLRPEALASLNGSAITLNSRAGGVFLRTDSVVRAANTYFEPLRGRQEDPAGLASVAGPTSRQEPRAREPKAPVQL